MPRRAIAWPTRNSGWSPTVQARYRVVYDVDEGDKIKIGDIDFEGNTVYRDLRLRWVMKKTKESSLATKFGKKDIYNPAALAEDLELVKTLYRDAGYKNVILGEPDIEVLGEPSDPAASDRHKRRLRVTIPIEEGQRWRLGAVNIDGAERFNAQILSSLFAEPKGGLVTAVGDHQGRGVADRALLQQRLPVHQHPDRDRRA